MEIDYTYYRQLDQTTPSLDERAQTIPLPLGKKTQKPLSRISSTVPRHQKSRVAKARLQEINETNQILLRRMLSIDAQPPFFQSGSFEMKRPLNITTKYQKKRNQLDEANKKLQKRLQSTQSHYKFEKFNKDYEFVMKFKRLHSKLQQSNNFQEKNHKKSLTYYDILLAQELKRQEMYKKNVFFNP